MVHMHPVARTCDDATLLHVLNVLMLTVTTLTPGCVTLKVANALPA